MLYIMLEEAFRVGPPMGMMTAVVLCVSRVWTYLDKKEINERGDRVVKRVLSSFLKVLLSSSIHPCVREKHPTSL